MAEMTIRLVCDRVTGKKDIIVSLRSDDDALPHEHEKHHRALVDKLIEGGVLDEGEVGSIVVQREEVQSDGAAAERSNEVGETSEADQRRTLAEDG